MANFALEQRRNRRRLRLLLLACLGLALVAGRVVGGVAERLFASKHHARRLAEPGWSPPPLEDRRHWYSLAFLALAYAITRRAWRDADRRFLAVTRARPLEDRTARNVVEELALAAGLPAPELFVVEDPVPNAFALGVRRRGVERGTIVVTRGLLDALQRDELQAVLAHEVGHLRAGDARCMTALLGLSNALRLFAGLALAPLHAGWEALGAADDASAPATTTPSRVGEAPDDDAPRGLRWLRPARPSEVGWIAWLARGIGRAVLGGTLAVVLAALIFLVPLVLFFLLPVVALVWALVETFRRDDPPAAPPASLEEERTGRTLRSMGLMLLFPAGAVVVGPGILALGVVLPFVAALGRVVVSRNRELDADVAAVELTRDPAALADALRVLRDRAAPSSAVPRWLSPLTIAPIVRDGDDAGADFVVAWRRFWSGSPSLDERIRRADAMTLAGEQGEQGKQREQGERGARRMNTSIALSRGSRGTGARG